MPSLADSQWAYAELEFTKCTCYCLWSSLSWPRSDFYIQPPIRDWQTTLVRDAPGGFSYINTQINQTHATPGNGWPNSTVLHKLSLCCPFNVAEFNNRVTQELLQTTRSGSTPAQPAQPLQPVQRPQPAGYGPPHLQNAPQVSTKTILGRPNENAPPKKGTRSNI